MHVTRSVAFVVTGGILIGSLESGLRARQDSDDERFAVTLANRVFVPEPGIDEELFSMVDEPGETRVAVIVQLFRAPSPAARAELHDAGVELTTFLGGITYLGELSLAINLAGLTEFVEDGLVRWVGPLRPEDKIQRQLWHREAEDWAMTSNGRFKVLVTLSPELDEEAAGRLLGRHVDGAKPHGTSGEWAIEIGWENLRELASERAVRWLQFGPLPMMLLGGNHAATGSLLAFVAGAQRRAEQVSTRRVPTARKLFRALVATCGISGHLPRDLVPLTSPWKKSVR